jgi:hypothetical protein
MRHEIAFRLAAFVSAVFVNSAFGDEIDVVQELKNRLEGTLPIIETDRMNAFCNQMADAAVARAVRHCRDLNLSNIRLYDAIVTKSTIKPASIPTVSKIETFVYPNCSGSPDSDKNEKDITYTDGYTVTQGTTLRNTQGADVKLTFNALSATANGNQTVEMTDQTKWDQTRTETEKIPYDETTPAWTLRVVTIRKDISAAYLDFEGTVTADADITGRTCCGLSISIAPDVRDYGKVSDFAKPPILLNLHGEIWNGQAQTTVKSVTDVKLPQSSAECIKQTQDALDKLPINGHADARLQRRTRAVALDASSSSQTIIPFVDGMTITTANVVGNVEVHAQSQGPGFCAVTFSAGGFNVLVSAPPYKYSDWQIVANNIGSVSLTITDDVNCDTGVLAEIRYWK